MTNTEKFGFSILSASIGTFFIGARRSLQHFEGNKIEYLIIFFGIFFATLTYFFMFKRKTDLICPKCETTFETKNIKIEKCPDCMVGVEKLKGYYKRHPEKGN